MAKLTFWHRNVGFSLFLQDLEDAIKMAGFTGKAIVGDMHAFRATDPREKDIAEGHNPIQVGNNAFYLTDKYGVLAVGSILLALQLLVQIL